LIGEADFAAGMAAIGIAVRQEADPATLAVYHDVLATRTDPDEWRAFVRWGLESSRWTWFPKLAELQDALREFRGDPPMLAEATEAYERVLKAGTYCPEGGTTWEYRSIREKVGEAAAEAFLAAGGNSAFANTWDESKRRERFVAAYGEAVRESPETKLLPPVSYRALPPAESPPTREEAVSVVEKLRDLAGVEPPKPKTTVVEVDPARVEALKRQAEASGEPT
jgi:hypothetical protein